MGKIKFPKLVKVAVYQRTDKNEIIKKSERITTKFIEENLKNENWASLKWYRDLKKSTNDERPAFNRLIKDIFEENVNLLIVIGELNRLSSTNETIFKIIDNITTINIEYDKQIHIWGYRALYANGTMIKEYEEIL